ncbi:MAG: DUF2271 domain-containing protein [Planctomycetales bacterium]|nr:DUF2271 domain-containing protein [Planctomycetales bacterium]
MPAVRLSVLTLALSLLASSTALAQSRRVEVRFTPTARAQLAVWIEDAEGVPVRTLCLFVMKNDPGPRWHRDLRRWYAGDQMRMLVDDRDLIATVAKPTRNPGRYKASWDGKDDAGKMAPHGKYTLYIEAAREHGTYQLMKHDFQWGGKPFQSELKPNVEIGSAKIRYRTSAEKK